MNRQIAFSLVFLLGACAELTGEPAPTMTTRHRYAQPTTHLLAVCIDDSPTSLVACTNLVRSASSKIWVQGFVSVDELHEWMDHGERLPQLIVTDWFLDTDGVPHDKQGDWVVDEYSHARSTEDSHVEVAVISSFATSARSEGAALRGRGACAVIDKKNLQTELIPAVRRCLGLDD